MAARRKYLNKVEIEASEAMLRIMADESQALYKRVKELAEWYRSCSPTYCSPAHLIAARIELALKGDSDGE